MSRLVGRVHFRIAITSLIIVLFGIGIMVNGICKTLLYYSSPADLCSLREDELSNSRVELSDYSVVWSFNASGYLYYVIEYKTGEYTLVEVNDNSYYSEKIKHHKRNGIDDQEYVINRRMIILGTRMFPDCSQKLRKRNGIQRIDGFLPRDVVL